MKTGIQKFFPAATGASKESIESELLRRSLEKHGANRDPLILPKKRIVIGQAISSIDVVESNVVALIETKDSSKALFYKNLKSEAPALEDQQSFFEENYFNKFPAEHLESLPAKRARGEKEKAKDRGTATEVFAADGCVHIQGPPCFIYEAKWISESKVACAKSDSTIGLVNIESGHQDVLGRRNDLLPEKGFRGHTDAIKKVLSLNRSTLVSGGRDGKICIFDLRMSYQPAMTSDKGSFELPAFNFKYRNSNGISPSISGLVNLNNDLMQLVASTSQDTTLAFFDLRMLEEAQMRLCTNEQLKFATGNSGHPVPDMSQFKCFELSPGFYGGEAGNFGPFYETYSRVKAKASTKPGISDLKLQGGLLSALETSGDTLIYKADKLDLEEPKLITGIQQPRSIEVLSPDFILAAYKQDFTLSVWRAAVESERVCQLGTPQGPCSGAPRYGHLEEVTGFHYDKQRHQVVSGSLDCSIIVWDIL